MSKKTNLVNRRRLTTRSRSSRPPAGIALLCSLFFLSWVVVLLVSIMDSTTLELAVLRNSKDYERAYQLASAGVHHAAAMLEDDPTWLTTVTDGSYPADDTYQATFAAGPYQTVVVTSRGVAGSVTRIIQATIEL